MLFFRRILPFVVTIVAVWAGCNAPQKEFDIVKFLGPWTIHSFRAPDGAEPPLRCIKVDFAPKGFNQYHANLTGNLLLDGSFYTDDGPMTVDDPEHPARINITWKGRNYFMTILESDYDNYAVVNGCAEDDGFNLASYSSIFTRYPDFPDDKVKRVKKSLEDIGIDTSLLFKVDNRDC